MRKIYLWDGHNGAVSFRVFGVIGIHVNTIRRAETAHGLHKRPQTYKAGQTFEALLREIKTVGMPKGRTIA